MAKNYWWRAQLNSICARWTIIASVNPSSTNGMNCWTLPCCTKLLLARIPAEFCSNGGFHPGGCNQKPRNFLSPLNNILKAKFCPHPINCLKHKEETLEHGSHFTRYVLSGIITSKNGFETNVSSFPNSKEPSLAYQTKLSWASEMTWLRSCLTYHISMAILRNCGTEATGWVELWCGVTQNTAFVPSVKFWVHWERLGSRVRCHTRRCLLLPGLCNPGQVTHPNPWPHAPNLHLHWFLCN